MTFPKIGDLKKPSLTLTFGTALGKLRAYFASESKYNIIGMSEQKSKGRTHQGDVPSVADSPTDSFLKRYKIIEKIGEGSYSEVLKCKNRETGSLVASKRLKHVYRNWSQVNDIAEITTLRTLARHINILQLIEIHYDQRLGKVSLVFEIMEMNLYELIKDRKRLLPEIRVRKLMFQLMRALRHLHKHGVFHRDIKPENILLRPKSDHLKLGDLGSVRGLYSRPPFTEYISTRWYRSPECLLTAGYYGFKMDVWAAGCVLYEILTLRPLFPGSSELDQINRIHNVMGPPPQKVLQKFYKQAEVDKDSYRNRSQQSRWEGMRQVIDDMKSKFEFSEGKSKNFDWYFVGKENGGLDRVLPQHISVDAKDLVKMMLTYDPGSRPTAHRVLQHGYLVDVGSETQAEKDSKSPIIAVFGDERGRQMISQHYAHVDLKTLGDKKHMHKRNKENRMAIAKKEQAKLIAPKKSSPILKGAGSPGTPQNIDDNINSRKPLNPMKSSGVELIKKQYQEKQKVASEKLNKKQSAVKVVIEPDLSSLSSLTPQDTPSTSEKPIMKRVEKSPLQIPEQLTLTARKRQVLAGNLPPSVLQTITITKEIEKKPSLSSMQSSSPASNSATTGAKLITHSLTPSDFNEMNKARQMLKLDLFGKPITKPLPVSKDSPYTKPPAELSAAGRKKLILQAMKQKPVAPGSQIPTMERMKMDSSTKHVPPQVAAARLKYTSQSNIAARKAREALEEFPSNSRSPTLSWKSLSTTESNKDFSIGKSRFGLSRIPAAAPKKEETTTQKSIKHMLDLLENMRKSPSLKKETLPPKLISPEVPSPIPTQKAPLQKEKSMTKLDIYETLDLNKQNRLSLRLKGDAAEENNTSASTNTPEPLKSKIPPYTKYPPMEKSEQKSSKFHQTSAEKEFSKNTTDLAANPMFPRNRFGSSAADSSGSNNKKSLLSSRIVERMPKNKEIYVPQTDVNMNIINISKDKERETSMTKRYSSNYSVDSNSISTKSDAASKAAARLGLSLPSEAAKENSLYKKPPLPPSNLNTIKGPLVDRNGNDTMNQSNTQEKATRIARLIENEYKTKSKVKEDKKAKSKLPTLLGDTEAMKRRTDRIKAQVYRDDVYCSSDDDIVSTIRQKLDNLIVERARRCSESSCDTTFQEDEDVSLLSHRSKHERPRKYLKRDSISRVGSSSRSHNQSSHGKTIETNTPHSLSIGDALKRSEKQYLNSSYVTRNLVQQTESGHRGKLFTPPGNKPTYQSAHQSAQAGLILDRKIGHTHNAPIIPTPQMSSETLRREDESKQPRRRMHHLA